MKYRSQSIEYATWHRMIKRCYDKSSYRYSDWGGRGIRVCERWLSSYDNFVADMGKRPKNKTSINRIDNEKNYSPENCEWSNARKQANNTRKNVKVTIDGVTRTVSEWCQIYNLKVSSIFDRINKRNQDPKEAILTPMKKSLTVKYKGKTKTVAEWCKELGLHSQSVNRCIRKGMTPEKAIAHIKENSWQKKREK